MHRRVPPCRYARSVRSPDRPVAHVPEQGLRVGAGDRMRHADSQLITPALIPAGVCDKLAGS